MKNLPSEQLELMSKTIDHAIRTTPYYAQAFKGLGSKVACWEDLRRFPILHRNVLVSRWAEFLAQSEVPVAVGMTGGTTEQHPLLVWKAKQDIEAKELIYAALRGQSTVRPLLMHLVNVAHGLDPGGARDGCFQVPLERPHHFDTITELLEHSFSFPGYTTRVRALAGSLRLLKALTMLCQERGIDSRRFAISLVSSSSDQLTSRWRGLLEDFWRAPVAETYGLSEVPGLHAHRCGECSHFHFSPLAVTELLSLDSDELSPNGIGRLVATSLYPLAVMQPIIRYDTGDVLECVGECPRWGVTGFEFLGRIPQVVTAQGDRGAELLLGASVINDVLDRVPEVARRQLTFAHPLGLTENIGFPSWSLSSTGENSGVRVIVNVALCWSPRQFPEAARRVEQRVLTHLMAAAPLLSQWVTMAKAKVEVRASYGLSSPSSRAEVGTSGQTSEV